jgi:hypothetical protein
LFHTSILMSIRTFNILGSIFFHLNSLKSRWFCKSFESVTQLQEPSICVRRRADTLDLQMKMLCLLVILLCRCGTTALDCPVEHVYV